MICSQIKKIKLIIVFVNADQCQRLSSIVLFLPQHCPRFGFVCGVNCMVCLLDYPRPLLQPFQPGRLSSRAAIPALEFENVFIKQNGSYILYTSLYYRLRHETTFIIAGPQRI